MEKHMAFGNTPPRHTRRDALKGLAGFAVAAGILPLASFAAAAADSSRKILIAYFSHTGNTPGRGRDDPCRRRRRHI